MRSLSHTPTQAAAAADDAPWVVKRLHRRHGPLAIPVIPICHRPAPTKRVPSRPLSPLKLKLVLALALLHVVHHGEAAFPHAVEEEAVVGRVQAHGPWHVEVEGRGEALHLLMMMDREI